MGVELEAWRQKVPESAPDVHKHVRHALERVAEISRDVQGLSHRLHSSKLEYLGIAVAAKSFCIEFSEQHNVHLEFSSDVPLSVPRDVSLALFRVLQEALQNGIKHGDAEQFCVELKCVNREIHLTVSDTGKGFEPHDVMSSMGLGLISMRERMQFVNGTFSVESEPGRGTTIRAYVPFDPEEHRISMAS